MYLRFLVVKRKHICVIYCRSELWNKTFLTKTRTLNYTKGRIGQYLMASIVLACYLFGLSYLMYEHVPGVTWPCWHREVSRCQSQTKIVRPRYLHCSDQSPPIFGHRGVRVWLWLQCWYELPLNMLASIHLNLVNIWNYSFLQKIDQKILHIWSLKQYVWKDTLPCPRSLWGFGRRNTYLCVIWFQR